jgi:hypothetical protein
MIDKLVPRYLNKDDDARLVKSVEMTDALNVRLSADTDGDDGVIKNAFGNSAVSFRTGNNWQGLPHALPSGTNKVVGSVSDLKNGVIIYFVYNSNADHSIYRYTTSQDVVELVYRDSVLAFQADSFVKGDIINNLYNEVLLYFTDGISAPKKLNVSRAIIGGYSDVITNGTDEQKLEFITLAKKPPLDPPTYEFFTDVTYDDNNIYESNFQFAYQYVYLDGEYSAISKYTDLAVAPNQYLDGFIEDAQRNEYNAIRVFVETSTADVKTIRVLGRRGNAGPWFIVDEIQNPALSSPTTLSTEFRNDELYRFISQDEANKIYDAVPLSAQSQTISGSRLFLGNYSEGYPNVNLKVSLYPNYDKESSVYNIPVTIDETTTFVNGNTQYTVDGISFDLSSVSAVTFSSDAILHVDIAFAFNDLVIDAPDAFIDWVELDEDLVRHNAGGVLAGDGIRVQPAPISINSNIVVPAGSTITDIADAIVSLVQKTYSSTLSSNTSDFLYATRFRNNIAPPIGNIVLDGDITIYRWGFFQGTWKFNLSSGGLNTTTNNLKFVVSSIPTVSLNLSSVAGGGPDSPNLQKQYNVDTSGTLTITNMSYTKYVLGVVPTGGNNEDPYVVPVGNGATANAFYILGYKPSSASNLNNFTKTYELLESSSFVADEIEGYKQFKSGATHELGFVLFDDRGRPTGVQKAGKTYVDWYGSRNYRGKNSIVMRLAGSVPQWAKSWAPVYTKKGSIESFVQYSVIDGFAATNVEAINSPSNLANNDYIFLSFRSLEGKDDSYKESKGANLEYNFVEGDRLRIVSYQEEDGQYSFTVSSTTGTINVGDVLLQFNISGVSVLQVTSVSLVAGAGIITAVLSSGAPAPQASGSLANIVSGALVTYSSFSLSESKVYPSNIEFDVVGYEELVDDLDTNPVLDRSTDDTIYNTTGKFLVLKDKNIPAFSKNAIVNGVDLWSKKCLVEIYRKRKGQDEEVYYEIGKSYDVVNGLLTGDRTVVSQVAALCTNERPLQFRTDVQLYPGDVLSDGSGRSFEVQNVYPEVNSIYNYFVDTTLATGSFTAGQTYTLNITNSSLVAVELTEGDTYFRLRQLRYGSDPNSYNYFIEYVESDEVSDFYESKNTSIGRPFAVLPDAKTVYRTGSVTYSEPFIIDVTRLGLSSFNPSLAQFYDLNYIHGSIRYMVNRDDSVIFLQDKKCGLFPVNRNLIEYVNGQQGVTVSTSIVGTPNYYAGEFGVGNNPESVAVEGGRVYFADIRNGKVIRISQDGITPISEAKMDAYFKDNFRDIVQFASVKRVIAGVDDEAGEYIISSNAIYTSTITIDGDGVDITTAFQARCESDGGTFEGAACFDLAIESLLGDFTFQLQTDTAGSVIFSDIEYNDDKLLQFNTDVRDFQDICDTFDNSINAVVYLDRLSAGQPIIVGEEFQGTNSTIYGVATNSTYDFFVGISINLAEGTFTFINSCGNYDGTIASPTATTGGFTVAYDTDNKVWNTRYSYFPERIASLDDTLYTFKNGTMYVHDSTANRATYYGTGYGAIVEVISNNNASLVKSYESLSLEGTSAWAATITNTDQSTSILSADFNQREREWFAYVPRDTSANTGTATITSLSGSSEMFVLGNVATSGVSGSTITFTTPVGDVAFPIGGALYKVSGSTFVTLNLTVTSISGDKSIDANGVIAGVNDGDTIVVLANAGIEGDQLRDYYAQISLTNSSTSEIELYAVNAVYAKSNLHNELGQ